MLRMRSSIKKDGQSGIKAFFEYQFLSLKFLEEVSKGSFMIDDIIMKLKT